MNEYLTRTITDFVRNYKSRHGTKSNWKPPLVSFADAADPLFPQLKKLIRPSHQTPKELLADAKTVVAYFVPFSEEIALSNIGRKEASPEWATAYIETNQLIKDLNEHLAGKLREKGFESVVLPPTHNFDEEKLVSDWSHKHIAYIAGLGNFGLHQLLITEKGCCGRLGSLVTNARTTPTKRTGKENCLYKKNGSCGMCVNNCFSGALSKESFNRHTCYKYCLANAKLYQKFGLADVCGKCACGVPCSFQNPVR